MLQFRSFILAGVISFLQCTQLRAQDIGSSIVSGYEERKEKAIAALKKFPHPDTGRVNALVDVISTALIKKQRQELFPYCEEAISISRQLNYQEGLVKCYVWKGHFYKSELYRETAHLYYDSAIKLAKGSFNETLLEYKANSHRGKAWIYHEQENYYTALNHFFEALKYFESRNKVATMNLYTIIANTYSRVNNYPQAIVYATKNVTLATQGADTIMQVQAHLSLAEIYLRNNELALATIYLDKMKPYMPDPVQLMINSGYYMNRGLIYFMEQQYDSSIFYYQKAYEVAAASRHNDNKTAALYYLSKAALQSGKTELAKKYADENLAVADKINAKIGKINALLNLSDYYHEINDNAKAYTFLANAAALKDSLSVEANLNQMNTLAAVYESDKKEKEIIQLQSEKEIQTASVKQKSLLNKFFIGSIIALLFFGYLGYINFKKNQQLTKQEQELQQQKIIELEKDKQLLTINAMLKGQEEERSRIAKELHDGIGSLLSGTKMSFINVKEHIALSVENKTMFDRSVSMLDNTIGDLRKVAQNLMPETLVKFGLEDALRDFCRSMQSLPAVKILYQQFGENRKLENTAEVYIYRIIQELVNNAVKHANASEIIVQLTMHEHKISITVEDNGKGFDKYKLATTSGNGMTNLQYRVQYFNGKLDIVSSPGNGTSVNIQLIA
ncbi:hypothetical protein CAP36_14740 [Chitinophagaceae bacterium IBVUCB2]|nr:hypothetical protein CAP36_14740 [Chitinophagaceae bacterium IBVUCB2]